MSAVLQPSLLLILCLCHVSLSAFLANNQEGFQLLKQASFYFGFTPIITVGSSCLRPVVNIGMQYYLMQQELQGKGSGGRYWWASFLQ